LIGAEGKNTKFFGNGRTYVKVLRRASGRPYSALAQAYIVSALNTLHGAPVTPEVETAMGWVERYCAKRKPRYTSMKHVHGAQAKIKKIKRLRNKMVRHAGTLKDNGDMPRRTV